MKRLWRLVACGAVVVGVLFGMEAAAFAHAPQGEQGTGNENRAIADPVDQSIHEGNIEGGAFSHGALE